MGAPVHRLLGSPVLPYTEWSCQAAGQDIPQRAVRLALPDTVALA